MMSKYTIFIFAIVLIMSAASAAVFASSKQYSGGITVAHSNDMAPLSFSGLDNSAKGIIPDFWRKWSEKTGIPVTFRLVKWERSLEMVASGEADVHGGLFLTEDRRPLLDFSDPFMPMRTYLFAIKGAQISNVSDLGSYRVGVLNKGAAHEFMAREHSEVTLKTYDSARDVTQALVAHEISAVVMDYPTVLYLSGTLGAVREIIPVHPVYSEMLRAGIARGNDKLMAVVEKGLAQMDDELRESIKARWFIESTPTVSPLVLTLGLSAVGLLICFSLYLYVSFRKGKGA